MSEHPPLPPCNCLPVPRTATLDGKDGWLHVKDDCPKHGRDRLTAPERAAITEAVNGPIPEPYGTRAEYVCATVEACIPPRKSTPT